MSVKQWLPTTHEINSVPLLWLSLTNMASTILNEFLIAIAVLATGEERPAASLKNNC